MNSRRKRKRAETPEQAAERIWQKVRGAQQAILENLAIGRPFRVAVSGDGVKVTD